MLQMYQSPILSLALPGCPCAMAVPSVFSWVPPLVIVHPLAMSGTADGPCYYHMTMPIPVNCCGTAEHQRGHDLHWVCSWSLALQGQPALTAPWCLSLWVAGILWASRKMKTVKLHWKVAMRSFCSHMLVLYTYFDPTKGQAVEIRQRCMQLILPISVLWWLWKLYWWWQLSENIFSIALFLSCQLQWYRFVSGFQTRSIKQIDMPDWI